VQLEKQAALLENEKQKMEDLEATHQQAMDAWTQSLVPRQQVRLFYSLHAVTTYPSVL